MKRKPQNTLKDCCLSIKQEFVRYVVVKFTNKKFGVLDRTHHQLLDVNNFKFIDRNDNHTILVSGQTTDKRAKEIVKLLNKEHKDTQFTEIE